MNAAIVRASSLLLGFQSSCAAAVGIRRLANKAGEVRVLLLQPVFTHRAMCVVVAGS
jgi:hypothetical protein